jgi:hypothetical protein
MSLLDDVRDFVDQKATTGVCGRCVLTRAERNICAGADRLGVLGHGRLLRCDVRMDAEVLQVPPEVPFQIGASSIMEALPRSNGLFPH